MKTIKTQYYVIYEETNVNVNESQFISNLQNKLMDVVKLTVDLFRNQPDILTQQTNRYTRNTNKLGFYMVYNKRTRKFYLGSSKEFSLRVAYYKRDFRNYFSGRSSKLYQSFINDIRGNGCNENDYYFISLITFDKNSTTLINLENFVSSVSCSIEPISKFLETVEFNAINYFLSQTNYSELLYNQTATGRFVIGNTLRSPNSGSKPKPIKLNDLNFAWESVSLVALFLNVDRRTIRNKIGRKFDYITVSEFQTWDPSKKITSANVNSLTNVRESILNFYEK